MNSANNAVTSEHVTLQNGSNGGSRLIESEDMDLSDEEEHSSTLSNGNSHVNGNSHIDEDEEMGMLLLYLLLLSFDEYIYLHYSR